MAGGSGNAAAVIKGLNTMWKLNLSEEEMSEIGVQIGADIPFCLMGGTCLAEGIGDKVTELNDFSWNNILIIKPEFSMSTAFVYKNLEPENYNLYKNNRILEYISLNDYENAGLSVENTLEKVVEKFHPEINGIKKLMLDNGAISSVMTGSGSAIFALFKDTVSLNKAYQIAVKIYPDTFMTKTVADGTKFIN
jgi:4-diphosphocytidyl-2-C-methyl-D-erythritol kinase